MQVVPTGCPVTEGEILVLRENPQFWPNQKSPLVNIDPNMTPFNILEKKIFGPVLKSEISNSISG